MENTSKSDGEVEIHTVIKMSVGVDMTMMVMTMMLAMMIVESVGKEALVVIGINIDEGKNYSNSIF